MTFTTTIKRVFMDKKLQDLRESGRFTEWKEDKPFWRTRVSSVRRDLEAGDVVGAVFLVGRQVYRYRVLSVREVGRDEVPDRYRGAITTERVYGLEISEV